MENIIEWGQIVNVHGVRGELKVIPWVDIASLAKKIKTFDIDGRSYGIVSVRAHRDMILLKLEGVDTMDRAEALKNKVLTTPRDAVDLGKGHYFYSDLIGFDVYDETTRAFIGRLGRIENYPSGDMYVISRDSREVMIPIVPEFDRGVDLEGRRVNVATIRGMLEDDED